MSPYYWSSTNTYVFYMHGSDDFAGRLYNASVLYSALGVRPEISLDYW